MAPMTRGFSPNGIPGPDVAQYYASRARAEVGLIISEGTVVDRPSASNDPAYPHFYGEGALQGWHKIIDGVHGAGGKMAPQLWHLGVVKPKAWTPPQPFEGPSGLVTPDEMGGVAMDKAAIDKVIAAFIQSAVDAKALGFDAIELHGAHGYLIDQFFWQKMNLRNDIYGGPSIQQRSKFAIDIVKGIRQAVGEDYPIILRISQWKQQDYSAKIAANPQELEQWVAPLAAAGVDIFHCSQRRYWEPEFPGSDLNFAGWVKKVTGQPTITVGSVGLSGEFLQAFRGEGAAHQSFETLLTMLDRGDFDLVAVGRAILADPQWVEKIRDHRLSELQGFKREDLSKLCW